MSKTKLFKVLAIGLALLAVTAGAFAAGPVKTYKFGVMAPITGTNAEYGKGFKIATQMAVDEINAKGEIKIELVVKDSKGDPKESADIARLFGDDASIMGIIGDFSSSSCMAAAPIVDEAGLVLVSPTASNPNYASMSKWAYSVMGRQDGEAPFFSTYLLKKFAGAKDIGVIWINSDWGKSSHDNLVAQAVKDGLNVVSDVNYIADEKDFSASIAKLRRGKPDHIIILDQGAVPTIINQIAQAGWKDVKITTPRPRNLTADYQPLRRQRRRPPPHNALLLRHQQQEGHGLVQHLRESRRLPAHRSPRLRLRRRVSSRRRHQELRRQGDEGLDPREPRLQQDLLRIDRPHRLPPRRRHLQEVSDRRRRERPVREEDRFRLREIIPSRFVAVVRKPSGLPTTAPVLSGIRVPLDPRVKEGKWTTTFRNL